MDIGTSLLFCLAALLLVGLMVFVRFIVRVVLFFIGIQRMVWLTVTQCQEMGHTPIVTVMCVSAFLDDGEAALRPRPDLTVEELTDAGYGVEHAERNFAHWRKKLSDAVLFRRNPELFEFQIRGGGRRKRTLRFLSLRFPRAAPQLA